MAYRVVDKVLLESSGSYVSGQDGSATFVNERPVLEIGDLVCFKTEAHKKNRILYKVHDIWIRFYRGGNNSVQYVFDLDELRVRLSDGQCALYEEITLATI